MKSPQLPNPRPTWGLYRTVCFLFIGLALPTLLLAQPFERAKLVSSDASDLTEFDLFGNTVAVHDYRTLVGAYQDDAASSDAGAAYLFERQELGVWTDVIKLTASDGAAADRFGWSVALWEGYALVGACRHDGVADDAGAVYVFEQQGDGTWAEVAKLTPTDATPGDEFGHAVALYGDRALIGALRDTDDTTEIGVVYVFERQSDGTWAEVTQFNASDPALDQAGRWLALWADRALVGAWLADDAAATDVGVAYVFERQGDGTWAEVATLTASDGIEGDGFAWSVALWEDRAAVGAYLHDTAGDNAGAVYVFEGQGDGTWEEADKLTATDAAGGDNFGNTIALWADRLVVGAPLDDDDGTSSGGAYVFERGTNDTWAEANKLTASDGAQGDLFGLAVAAWADFVVVGAQFDDEGGEVSNINFNSGSVYVYDLVDRTSTEALAALPARLTLAGNYPNPFNPRTTIRYALAEPAPVQLSIHDVMGREVAVLRAGETQAAGHHEVAFEAGALPSGVYVYRVQTDTQVRTGQMLLLK